MDTSLQERVARHDAAIEFLLAEVRDLKAEVRALRNKQEQDFRILFSAIITLGLGEAFLIAKAVHWL